MSSGIRIYDASGTLIWDSSARYSRLIHTQNVTVSGSITLPAIANTLTYQWIQIGYAKWDSRNLGNVTVSRTGTTISWTIPSGISISAPLYVFGYT